MALISSFNRSISVASDLVVVVGRQSAELHMVGGIMMRSISYLGNWDSDLSNSRDGNLGYSRGSVDLDWGWLIVLDLGWLVVQTLDWGWLIMVDRGSSVGNWSYNFGNWGNKLGNWSNGLNSVVSLKRLTTDNSVETRVFIRGVFDHSAESISVNQSVNSLHVISMTFLLVALDVSGLFIMNRVLELIFSRSIRIFNVLHSFDQSRLQSLNQSRLNSFHQSWLSMVLWLMLVLWLMIVMGIVVLGSSNSQQSKQSNELSETNHII